MAITSGSAQVTIGVGYDISKALTGRNPVRSQQQRNSSVKFTSIGNGVGAFDQVYDAVRTLGNAANETLDLSGSLVNDFGETVTFVRIKSLTIQLDSGGATSITVGNTATNPFFGPLSGSNTVAETIRAGGHWSNGGGDATGWNVANNSSDNLKILNNDTNNASYRITVIGATS